MMLYIYSLVLIWQKYTVSLNCCRLMIYSVTQYVCSMYSLMSDAGWMITADKPCCNVHLTLKTCEPITLGQQETGKWNHVNERPPVLVGSCTDIFFLPFTGTGCVLLSFKYSLLLSWRNRAAGQDGFVSFRGFLSIKHQKIEKSQFTVTSSCVLILFLTKYLIPRQFIRSEAVKSH